MSGLDTGSACGLFVLEGNFDICTGLVYFF